MSLMRYLNFTALKASCPLDGTLFSKQRLYCHFAIFVSPDGKADHFQVSINSELGLQSISPLIEGVMMS